MNSLGANISEDSTVTLNLTDIFINQNASIGNQNITVSRDFLLALLSSSNITGGVPVTDLSNENLTNIVNGTISAFNL